jgi:hypothetical protein
MVDMSDRTRWTPVADPNLRLDADGRLGTVHLQMRVRIGEQVLDEHLFVLLRSIDGNRTVAQLAHHLDIGPIPLLRQVLSLMRRGWCRWAETPASER